MQQLLSVVRTDDIDPSRRTLRIGAETTKGRRERAVPYSASSNELLHHYIQHRRTLGQTRGPLFLSESRRNYTQPISIWSWSILEYALVEDGNAENEPQFIQARPVVVPGPAGRSMRRGKLYGLQASHCI